MSHFIKAMGLGNDFVLWPCPPNANARELSLNLANRRYGIGCDQIVFFATQPHHTQVWFYNSDGSEAETCGNGTRCLAKWLIQNNYCGDDEYVHIETPGGKIRGKQADNERITLEYSLPQNPIPVTVPEVDGPCYAVHVGNPHLVCWTKRFDELPTQGPILEKHPHFPNHTNVGFAKLDDNHIELKVWERGAGLTPACGSGALAAAYTAYIQNIIGQHVTVKQQGGLLDIEFNQHHACLTGDAHIIFEGNINPLYELWNDKNPTS